MLVENGVPRRYGYLPRRRIGYVNRVGNPARLNFGMGDAPQLPGQLGVLGFGESVVDCGAAIRNGALPPLLRHFGGLFCGRLSRALVRSAQQWGSPGKGPSRNSPLVIKGAGNEEAQQEVHRGGGLGGGQGRFRPIFGFGGR